jgi:abhydrolase domain-containing protein 12
MLRATRRKEVVSTTHIEGYGVLEEMHPSVVALEGRKVALLKTERGGHVIGRVEGVHDTIGRMFGFY